MPDVPNDELTELSTETKQQDAAVETVATEQEQDQESQSVSNVNVDESGQEAPPVKAEDQDDKPPKKRDGFQKRVDKLTRDNWRLTREVEALRDEREEHKTLEDFDGDQDKYQDYLRGLIVRDSVQAAREQLIEDQQRIARRDLQQDFAAREAQYAKDHQDYMQVTRNQNLPYTSTMHEIVCVLDEGPSVLHYLASNPDVSAQISQLPPQYQAMELAKLEAEVANSAPGEAANHISKAPDPPPKISSKSGEVKKDMHTMTQDEFNAYRRRYIANR